MTNEQLSKIDFPAATMQMLISTTAMVKTVLETQMILLKALNIPDQEKMVGQINDILQRNLAMVDSDLNSKVPQSFYINYPKN